MSHSYLFHLPRRLPLDHPDFGPDYAANIPSGPFTDRDTLERELTQLFPDARWEGDSASAMTDAGWVEPRLFEHEGLYWSLRCSLRNDYDALVQAICDRMGWIAFDERQRLFQPHRSPIQLT